MIQILNLSKLRHEVGQVIVKHLWVMIKKKVQIDSMLSALDICLVKIDAKRNYEYWY